MTGWDELDRFLQAFVAVATSRSFTCAAGQLFITEPALTRTVGQLEAQPEIAR